jgi:hypothetical protein
MKVAMVCIAKQEDEYIEEWIKYNFKLGFDDIFVYQNNWRWPVEMDNVYKIEFDGKPMQVAAYNNFLQTYDGRYDWVAFFDVDEFLVLKKHENVKDFIKDYSEYSAIGINWVLFGDNGLSFDGDYSVLSRFTKRQSGIDNHVKCIVRVDKNIDYSVHNPKYIPMVDTGFNTFTGPWNFNPKDDVAQLNHYFCKTWQEWQKKKSKGRVSHSADDPNDILQEHDFHRHNFNEIEDTTALNFYLS